MSLQEETFDKLLLGDHNYLTTMDQLFWFILGIIASTIIGLLFLYFSPSWEDSRTRFLRWLNEKLGRSKEKPLPPIEPRTLITFTDVELARLNPIRIGSLIFPMRVLIAGDGKTRYAYPDGVQCNWNPKPLVLPQDLYQAAPGFREKRRQEAVERRAVFVQREHVRIDDYTHPMEGMESDAPWPLELIVSTTDYYTIQGTNASIYEKLPDGSTVREKYAKDPSDLKNSVLANPLATNMSVVTSDGYIYIAIRGKKTATNPGGFAPAVSGTGNPITDCDNPRRYSPFLTAQREAEEEILSFKPDLSEITFFGLARTLKFQYPFLFGEIRLKKVTAAQLESYFPRDSWETEGFISMPLRIENVVKFIKRVYQELGEKNIVNTGTYTALFSLLKSLHYEYPDKWARVVKMLMFKREKQ